MGNKLDLSYTCDGTSPYPLSLSLSLAPSPAQAPPHIRGLQLSQQEISSASASASASASSLSELAGRKSALKVFGPIATAAIGAQASLGRRLEDKLEPAVASKVMADAVTLGLASQPRFTVGTFENSSQSFIVFAQ